MPAVFVRTIGVTMLTAGTVVAAAGMGNAAVIDSVSDSNGALAFSDSSSATWQNLPSFLDGVDYVRTANGDNSNSDLEVNLSINQPAILYVFHSDNVDDPGWLTTNFMDTGSDVTLNDSSGSDLTYSVFSVELNGSGSTTFTTFDNDPNTTNSEQRYGIAAAIPAPATGALAALAGFAGLRRRR